MSNNIATNALSGIIGGVGTAALLWSVGAFTQKLDRYDYESIAEALARDKVYRSMVTRELGFENAVIGVIAENCPDGWRKWKLASGRFLRGIDWAETGVDPDKNRAAGQLQEEAIGGHDHYFPNVYSGPDGGRVHGNYGAMPYQKPHANHGKNKVGAAQPDWKIPDNVTMNVETRPDNVAVLFCIKGDKS